MAKKSRKQRKKQRAAPPPQPAPQLPPPAKSPKGKVGRPPKPLPDDGYEKIKARSRERHASLSRSGRDIGPPPAVVNPKRREACRNNFRLYCETYFPKIFTLAWSPDHLKAIDKIEGAVLRGQLYAFAMARGSGKTSLAERGAMWATSYGHRSFVVLLGSTAGAAEELLDVIKGEFEGNDLLNEDFPTIAFPIRPIDGIANRCKGQLCQGERTKITWKKNEIALPTIQGSEASGAIIKVAGITGRIRGMHKIVDGTVIRPSLVIPDDPQDEDSAFSPVQCEKRERILMGAVLGLAGPEIRIAGLMPCTPIRAGDLACVFLDRTKKPDWQGEISKSVISFPSNQKLWDAYAELRAEALRTGDTSDPSTAFYVANREAMDAGSSVSWPERHPGCVSAIQWAMDLRIKDERAFMAEYQCDPMPEVDNTKNLLTPDQIAAKLNRLERGIVPLGAAHLTAFIDVHQDLLYYAVVASAGDFTAALVDYGAHPDQQRGYFTLRDARPTLSSLTPGTGTEGVVFAGLTALTASILGREWRREDGSGVKITRCLIDAGWANDTVRTFCRQSPHAAVLIASHGRYVGAKHAPISRWKAGPGERTGLEWQVKPDRQGRHCTHDHNFWASFVHARLAQTVGDKGSLTLFGDRPARHRLLADHLTGERPIEVEAGGRKVDEWTALPQRDVHLFDCVIGAMVGASIEGAALMGAKAARRRVPLSEMKRRGQ